MENVDLKRVKDGSYTGSATGFRGPVQVEITVKEGKIVSARITQHREDLPANAISYVPRRIVEEQGIGGVDAVTSATISSDAIINAAGKALGSGAK